MSLCSSPTRLQREIALGINHYAEIFQGENWPIGKEVPCLASTLAQRQKQQDYDNALSSTSLAIRMSELAQTVPRLLQRILIKSKNSKDINLLHTHTYTNSESAPGGLQTIRTVFKLHDQVDL